MRKFNSKIKNFFERRNLSKLTALGLSLALSATICGHAFSENAGNHSLDDPTSLEHQIRAHVKVVDATPQYNIRIDWESMNFVATITNRTDGNAPFHSVTWSGGGDNQATSKVWVQNGSSSPLNTEIRYAETNTNYWNIHGALRQVALEDPVEVDQANRTTWKSIDDNEVATNNGQRTVTTHMDLGTMPDGYVIAAPAGEHGNIANPDLVTYHDFRGVFSLTLSNMLADITPDNPVSKPARIIGNYDINSNANDGNGHLAGVTTLTFSQKADV